jgi:hypothetical protein
MRLRGSLLALALLVPLLVATAPARPAAAEEATFDVSFFYDHLAPHGDWVHLDEYGWVWWPKAAECLECDWRPYTVGYWAYVDSYGWTWVSTEEWGWATYHYGRWLYTDDYGWVWVPGTVWAPAWVSFRFGAGWVGWAPLPPTPRWRIDAGVDTVAVVEASIGSHAWAFVPVRWFGEPDLSVRYAPAVHAPYLVARTAPSTRLVAEGDFVVNRSIDVTYVERARGRAVVRYRPREATDPASVRIKARVDGDTLPVFRARIAPTATKKAPTPRVTRSLAPKDVDAWVETRRAAMKKHLDAQRAAAEKDVDDAPAGDSPAAPRGDVPPPPAPGMNAPPPAPGMDAPPPPSPAPAAPSAEEAQKRREAAKKALEEEQKRLERLLERQRRNLERRDAGDAPPPPPSEKDKEKKEKDKKEKDKDGMDG